MIPIKQQHNRQHQQRIENIQKHLMTKQIPRVPLQILNNPEHAPDHDEGAGDVQVEQVALPWEVCEVCVGGCHGRGGRDTSKTDAFLNGLVVDEAVVEDAGDNDEKAKEEELRE